LGDSFILESFVAANRMAISFGVRVFVVAFEKIAAIPAKFSATVP